MSNKPISKAAVLGAESQIPREYTIPKSKCPPDVLQEAVTYQDNIDTINIHDPDEQAMREEQIRMLKEGKIEPSKVNRKDYGFNETWKMKYASWTHKNTGAELVNKKVLQEFVEAHPYMYSVRQLVRESNPGKVDSVYNNIMNDKLTRHIPVKVIKRMAELLGLSDWLILVDIEKSRGSKTARFKIEKVYVTKLKEIEKRVRAKNKDFFKERDES